ncbi:hypothetical protein LTR17_013751 [Elasticomyces elasticus]|nr:hypothetical protein LTR17_013751 [Elasticomyces elasticus]
MAAGSLVRLLPKQNEHAANESYFRTSSNSVAGHLETLSSQVMEAHNKILEPGSLCFLGVHCSSDFRMTNPTDYKRRPCGWDSSKDLAMHLAGYTAFKKAHPRFYIAVKSASAVLTTDLLLAKVFVTAHGNVAECGHAMVWDPEATCDGSNERYFNRESINLLFWRATGNGDWACYRLTSLRGGLDLWTSTDC